MPSHTLTHWQHEHEFAADHQANERKTLRVVLLTAGMMALEIAAGSLFGSLALLADGWHMGTHAAALGIALLAYRYARQHARDPRYTFGVGKISVLGGFTSAVVLQVVAILMILEAIQRLLNPQPIRFDEAIFVAVVGLVVNLVSVRLLGDDPSHEHEHSHHDHDPADHNIRAAYLHVLADALTSVLAIIALLAGRALGWVWMDALMGVVGGVVISRWAIGLLRETSHILLDGRADETLEAQIRQCLESSADTHICDLHVWMIGAQAAAGIVSLVTHAPRPAEHYRALLAPIPLLKHVTIEVNVCVDPACVHNAGQ